MPGRFSPLDWRRGVGNDISNLACLWDNWYLAYRTRPA